MQVNGFMLHHVFQFIKQCFYVKVDGYLVSLWTGFVPSYFG